MAQIRPTTNAAILGQCPNGMAVNQNAADTAVPIPAGDGNPPLCLETVLRAIDDNVQMDGVHQNEASYPKGMFQIISDTFHNWPLETSHVDNLNAIRTFRPLVLKFNFSCNKQLKLIPFTTTM
eukprot:SAG11_NODE_2630_length_3158_cov_2.267408_2_plen_123_part_00